jgi:hypothetical protein
MNIGRSVFWAALMLVFCTPMARAQNSFADPFYGMGNFYLSPSRPGQDEIIYEQFEQPLSTLYL